MIRLRTQQLQRHRLQCIELVIKFDLLIRPIRIIQDISRRNRDGLRNNTAIHARRRETDAALLHGRQEVLGFVRDAGEIEGLEAEPGGGEGAGDGGLLDAAEAGREDTVRTDGEDCVGKGGVEDGEAWVGERADDVGEWVGVQVAVFGARGPGVGQFVSGFELGSYQRCWHQEVAKEAVPRSAYATCHPR